MRNYEKVLKSNQLIARSTVSNIDADRNTVKRIELP